MITPHEGALLAYLADFIEGEGHAPSFRQCAAALKLKSTSGIAERIHRLRDNGLLDFKNNTRRSLNLTEEGWKWANLNRKEGTPNA